MKNEKIIAAWDIMNPDSTAKEKMLRQIQSTVKTVIRADKEASVGTVIDADTGAGVMEDARINLMTDDGIAVKTDGKHAMRRSFARFSVGFAAAMILLLGTFGTAYATSPVFRDYVRALLFPLYTSDEFVSIENGHMTGSFDITDVLLSFLDRFNRLEFGNSITAAMDEGYHYSLFVQSGDKQDGQHLQAFVDSSTDGYCIVVFMERLEYEDTEGIWQITGYQILEIAAAQRAKSELMPYSEPSVPQGTAMQTTASVSQKDTSIHAAENAVLIYNVNEKKNTAALTEDDSKMLYSILENCDRLENIEGGLLQYVIKTDSISCLFDSQGRGMITEAANHQGIVIAEEELTAIMELFERYGISLEETE